MFYLSPVVCIFGALLVAAQVDARDEGELLAVGIKK